MTLARVIDLAAVKANLQPHAAGQARCLACQHTWAAVAPNVLDWLECPSCRVYAGRFINHVEKVGEAHWTCGCGNDLFFIQPDKIYCPMCGSTQAGY